MSYPEKDATYKHTPKFIDRMKEEETKNRDSGGMIGIPDSLLQSLGRFAQQPSNQTPVEDSPPPPDIKPMAPTGKASYDPKTGRVKGL